MRLGRDKNHEREEARSGLLPFFIPAFFVPSLPAFAKMFHGRGEEKRGGGCFDKHRESRTRKLLHIACRSQPPVSVALTNSAFAIFDICDCITILCNRLLQQAPPRGKPLLNWNFCCNAAQDPPWHARMPAGSPDEARKGERQAMAVSAERRSTLPANLRTHRYLPLYDLFTKPLKDIAAERPSP